MCNITNNLRKCLKKRDKSLQKIYNNTSLNFQTLISYNYVRGFTSVMAFTDSLPKQNRNTSA